MPKHPAPSLAIYFEETFIKAKLKDTKPGTVEAYRKATHRFLSWAGCNVRLHDVTEFLVERFFRALVIEGVGLKTTNCWATYVRAIVRHGSPGRMLKCEGKRPHESKPTAIKGLSEDELRAPQRSLLRFHQDVYAPRKMLGAKQGSIDQIRHTITLFGKHLSRPPLLDDLQNDIVVGWMSWVINVRGLSVATANNGRKNLLSLWLYAKKRGLIKSEPNDCDKLKQRREIPKAWTVAEFSRIIEAARLQTTPRAGMVWPAYVFWPCLLLVAYDTGLRLSALMGIKTADWNAETRVITVDAEWQKQRVSQTFIVSEQTAEAIRWMMTEREPAPDPLPEFLFAWSIRKEAVFEHFRAILERAGLYIKGEDTFHRIRKTCATHLAAAVGIEACCRQLGHSSVEMSRRYIDVRQTGHHDAAKHLPRPESNPKPR